MVLLIVLFTLVSLLNISLFSSEQSITGAANVGLATLCLNKPPTIVTIADQNATQGVEFILQISASDPENATLSYYDNTSLFDINGSGGIIFTPDSNAVGSNSILITVNDKTDCANQNVTDSFRLSVTGVASTSTTPTEEGGGGKKGAELSPPTTEDKPDEKKEVPKEKPIIYFEADDLESKDLSDTDQGTTAGTSTISKKSALAGFAINFEDIDVEVLPLAGLVVMAVSIISYLSYIKFSKDAINLSTRLLRLIKKK